jgi:hypothetical protein
VILEGIQQQQEAQRQQMLQHQMMTIHMFMFMFGCLCQLFQQSGLQLPQFPTSQQLQADSTAPLPPVGGFVNIPLTSFPQSPLLQTGMFAVPQMTTPQAVASTTFLDQLQMATPTSSQLPSPLTTGALVFEMPARTSLPSPRATSPLPSFTTPQTEGLGQEDHYLCVISEQISTAIASNPEVPGPRPLRLRLPAQGRLQLHLLHLRVPPLRLGPLSVTTLMTTTTPPASRFDPGGPSLPRRRILPLCLRLSFVFGACFQRGR